MVTNNLDKRLEQVRGCGVPYVIERGNQLPSKFLPSQIVRFIGHLPEVVDERGFDYQTSGGVYGENAEEKWVKEKSQRLAEVYGCENAELFYHRSGSGVGQISIINVENHYIYDIDRDITHIFLLPKGDLADKLSANIC